MKTNVTIAIFVISMCAFMLIYYISQPITHDILFDDDYESIHLTTKLGTAKTMNQAYISLVCDDTFVDQAAVLAMSWKKSRSRAPLVFLTLPYVTRERDLIALGASIHHVQPIDYPKERQDGSLASFHRICRYSKLHAWNLTEYDRGIFIDSDAIFVQNVDELFQEEELAGVPLAGDTINTGLFVLKPNHNMFSRMLSLYRKAPQWSNGDQGFINWFFANRNITRLSSKYNTIPRNKDFAIWPSMKANAKIIHFNGETTPWNFYHSAHPQWNYHMEPSLFYRWTRMFREVQKHLHLETFRIGDHGWANAERVSQVCDTIAPQYTNRKFTIKNKFSILIGTWDRVALLKKTIQHYQKSQFVHKIYVTWHNPAVQPPQDLIDLTKVQSGIPSVEIVPQSYNSLNNRFNPIKDISTKGVLICDDDIRVSIPDMEFGFEVWKNRPDSLVGFFPRNHYFDSNNATYAYDTMRFNGMPRKYTIMLTKLMFMSSDYLFLYSCLLPERIHQYIDQHMNCEDIAMAMMVSGLTGTASVAVKAKIDDFGTTSGISGKSGHLDTRSQCMTDLIRLFGKDTLVPNGEFMTRYRASNLTNNNSIFHLQMSEEE